MIQDHPLFRFFNEIGIIAQLSQRLFENVLPQGMTLAQFVVLNHFVRLGGERSPAALANAFQVTRATMTSTLQRLEGKEFVEIRPDPSDGRAKRVALTEKGREMRDLCIRSLAPEIERIAEKAQGHAIDALIPPLTGVRQMLDVDRPAQPKGSAHS